MSQLSDKKPCLKRLTLGLFALLVHASSVQAASFSGFASLGVGRVNDGNTRIAEYSESWSLRSDTVLGAQLDLPLTDTASLTAQGIIEGYSHDAESDYEPAIEWLFLSVQLSPLSRLRLGRLRSPSFLYSENLPVGFSYMWARPPIEVYNPVFVAVKNMEGMDVTTHRQWGLKDLELGFTLGRMKGRYRNNFLKGEPALGANIKIRDLDSLLRYSVLVVEGSQWDRGLNTLRSGLETAASRYEMMPMTSDLSGILRQISDNLVLEEKWIAYHSLAAEWASWGWSWVAELNYLGDPGAGFSPNLQGMYVSAARQFGQFHPYGVIGYSKMKLNDEVKNLVAASQEIVPPGTAAELDLLREASLSVSENLNTSGYSVTLGCRWDVHRKAALKVEFQYFDRLMDLTSAWSEAFDEEYNTLLTTVILDVIF